MINRPGRFAFVDAGEAARMLGIDRVTLEQWVRDGRLKAHRGVGRESFYRTADIEALYNEMHPSSELAEAIAADEQESAGAGGAPGKLLMPTRVQKKQDPQMRVYLRLQADAKWYDISEDDIRTWFQQLAPDGYERNKRNAEHTIKKLQYLVGLIEEAQGREETTSFCAFRAS
jgi:excisionase family DNA binding protein